MMMIENVLEDLREAKPELAITGIFITRFDARKNINKVVEEVRKQYANVIFNTHIRDNVSYQSVQVPTAQYLIMIQNQREHKTT